MTNWTFFVDYRNEDNTHTGTDGDDYYIFYNSRHGNDTIQNFTRGEDRIDLVAFYQRVSTFEQLEDYITKVDGNTIIDLTAIGGGTITLEGVTDLTGDDFTFEVYGTEGNDTLRSTDGHDQMFGGGGNDKIYGGGGEDYIEGGGGKDHIEGGAGDDSIWGDAGNDTIYGGGDSDRLYGGAGDDEIHGDAGGDFLYGGSGNDTLYGGEGGDSLYGGAGDDTIKGGAEADGLYGGGGSDKLYGGEGRDRLEGGAGNDELYGGAGSDALYGGGGDDILSGGLGNDKLYGGAGADTFVFEENNGADFINDFAVGKDVIDLSALTGIDSFDDLTITTNSFGDAIIDLSAHGGGEIRLRNVSADDLDADDFVFYQSSYTGTDEAETLEAGAGDDTIEGLGGDDTLTGNAGADTFVFAAGHGSDTVTDFADGEDLIDLSAFTGIAGYSDLTATQDGGNVVIDLSGQTGGGTITLQNAVLADIDEENFVFYEMPSDGG